MMGMFCMEIVTNPCRYKKGLLTLKSDLEKDRLRTNISHNLHYFLECVHGLNESSSKDPTQNRPSSKAVQVILVEE